MASTGAGDEKPGYFKPLDGSQNTMLGSRCSSIYPETHKWYTKRWIYIVLLSWTCYWAGTDGVSQALRKLNGGQHRVELKDPEDIWGTINPSTKLTWVSCYENLECARFAVPLDYSNEHGPQAAIALIKKPSKIPIGQDGYRGPILFNPGGPGGSGVDLVHLYGEYFSQVIGDDYDIIGFDPRGIGRSTPKVTAFASEEESAAFSMNNIGLPPLNSTADSFARNAAYADILGSLARERSGFAAQYVSTAFVARDMLSITRAHGRDKLLYWGISYGTVLGATYAAMFPDNVERLVLDGVVDSYDWYRAQWSKHLRDTDAGWRMFLDSCVSAGPDGCALYDTSASKIAARLEKLYTSLKINPLSVSLSQNDTAPASIEYGILDYSLVRGAIFVFLYNPYASPGLSIAAKLAHALAAIEKGDGYPMWQLFKLTLPKFDCKCNLLPAQMTTKGLENTLSVACSDGDIVNASLEELKDHYERMAKESSFAEFVNIRLLCSGWKVRSKNRFNGPLVGNTSHPILFVGNTADPVTPLWNAHKMSKGFTNATVLIQNSAGHSSLAATSVCTMKTIREYFRTGHMPTPGIICEVEDRMFEAPSADVHANLAEEDKGLLEAARKLREEPRTPVLPF